MESNDEARNPNPEEVTMTNPRTLSRFTFGDFSRYEASAFLTRFGTVEYIVTDAETECPKTGLPEIIRQAATLAEATKGLGFVRADDIAHMRREVRRNEAALAAIGFKA